MKKPNPMLSAEYTEKSANGTRGAVIKVVGNKENLLSLWLALTLNLCNTLETTPLRFAMFLMRFGPDSLSNLASQCTTIDFSDIVRGDH